MEFQTFKNIMSTLLKTWSLTENPPVQVCVNRIKSKIVFKTKTGYRLELLSPETMKLLRSTKKDVGQDEHGGDLPKLDLLKLF